MLSARDAGHRMAAPDGLKPRWSDQSGEPVSPGIGAPAESDAVAAKTLTLVVPTFNERDNLPEVYRRVESTLAGVEWEIVVVDDDSPDRTWEVAKALAQVDPRVRCIRRINRRGLAGACVEGALSSAATFVAVMDADLQHDETLLPRMLDLLRDGCADLVVGSRYSDEGGATDGLSKHRARLSRSANAFANRVLRIEISDPMSGFFMLRRSLFESLAPNLTSSGFKILADIVASAPANIRVKELGYSFRKRTAGLSKMDLGIGLDFLGLMLNKLSNGIIPVRFCFFMLTGLTGLVVHLTVLRLGLAVAGGLSFGVLQAIAAFVAMTSNFLINNLTTYSDMKLSGMGLVRGLLVFYCVCGIGTIANAGIASLIYDADHRWWLAGLIGAAMGAVWNYSLSSFFVWNRRN